MSAIKTNTFLNNQFHWNRYCDKHLIKWLIFKMYAPPPHQLNSNHITCTCCHSNMFLNISFIFLIVVRQRSLLYGKV